MEHQAPTSYMLRNLHEVSLPDPVSWWPQTIGWLVLLLILLVVVGFYAWLRLQRWWHNRYRREALLALAKLNPQDTEMPDKLYQLYKLVLNHLDAHNRGLFGQALLQRLDLYVISTEFSHHDELGKQWLDSLLTPKNTLTLEQRQALLVRSQWWLKHHQAEVKHELV